MVILFVWDCVEKYDGSWVGAAPVCPPVSPHKGASIVQFPAHHACIFGMETPLRGCSGTQAPPLRFRLGDCAQTVGSVWVDCAWVVDGVGWIMRGRLVSFGQITCGWLMPCGWITRGRLISFGWIACGRLASSLRYSARMPLCILFFYAFYFCSVYFFNG